MAVYQIVKKGDPILREKAKEVKEINDSILKLLDNMKETMYAANGVGLAAPQIGVSKCVIVVDIGDEELFELINPQIVFSEGLETDTEGCLSVPGIVGEVARAKKIKIKGLNRQGKTVEIEAEDLLARAFQHEMDHLDGILFIDKAQNLRTVE
ncbi:MAG: peptide deformylase [Bacillota bacterium]|uniref:Peptide deformylase n=1 Tax=Thermanaerosceptrum fracticalcis TaxID=1712410 RepID=A0A7G6E1P0_THEFR|nr:peptide deformylase [Thermanaerosceptrum fracticalcis]QNB45994.1 peptide deformylase [Thermanaerosceptrum fracticalcis]